MSDAAPTGSPADFPRTDAPRRRGRLNARTHGLTATLPDGAEEAALVHSFIDQWTAQLAPETEAESALIRSAAAASARLERCRKAEEDALRDAARRAVDRWEKTQRHAARKTAQGLDADPVNTVADLEASSFGCEWLMRHWRSLDAALAQGLRWDHREQAMAMALLGYRPQAPGPDGEPAAVRFWHLLRVASGIPVDPHPDLPDQPIPARAALRRLIAAEFGRLEALRDSLRAQHDRPEADAVARAGLVDTSKEGQLRQRYRREAFSEMVRGLKEAVRLRTERDKLDDRRRAREAQAPRSPGGLAWWKDRVEPTTAPTPSSDAPGPRNEPPGEADGPPDDRRNPIQSNPLRNESPEPPADPARRTGPSSGAHRPPTEDPRAAGMAPMAATIGPRSAASPADRAG